MLDFSDWTYRKSISAFILDSSDRLLLVSSIRSLDYKWNVPCGGVEKGETLEQALFRELKEEVSLEKDDLEILFKSKIVNKYDIPRNQVEARFMETGEKFKGQERFQFILRFKGRHDSIKVDNISQDDFRWVSLGELKDYLTFEPIYQNAIKVLKEFGLLLNV
jgi:putative (di)nucleoside polyphosphate hydrolase